MRSAEPRTRRLRAVAERWFVAPVLALVACGGDPPVEVAGLVLSECQIFGDTDEPPPSEELLLTGLDGALQVAHRAHELPCEAEIQLDARQVGEREIQVTYENSGEVAANCLCLYDLAYQLTELEPGTWVVRVPVAPGAQAEVD